MLDRLSIKNYAIIDKIEIDFSKGLTIITGETGAGKSIILGALSLILGHRSESRYFFNPEKKCVIEGFFDIEGYNLQEFFVEHDIDYEEQTILRREIYSEGKSRAFINDSPVNLAVMKSLAEQLVAIHSQHAILEINKESFQLLTLDSIAKNEQLLKQFQDHFKQYKLVTAELDNLLMAAKKMQSEADYHQFLFDELFAANLEDGEQELLESELNKLNHAEEIKRGLNRAGHLMSEQEQPALLMIKEALAGVREAEQYLPHLSEVAGRLNSSYIELKDIADEIFHLESEIVVDKERLQIIEDRLSLIYKLQQKHQTSSIAELILIQNQLDENIAALFLNEEKIATLKVEKAKLIKQSIDDASHLTESRQKVIPKIEKQIHELLQDAGMPHAAFKVVLNELPEDNLNDSGGNSVEFLFNANMGQTLQPINKVASGGELSRLMLALKSIIAQNTSLPTLIFDEIDTGISGEIALKVGKIMENLSSNLQIIAITHLPQMAARGSSHFKVFKKQKGTITNTDISLLGPEERIKEIAQMLGGEQLSETAIMHAKELLNSI